jgi:arylsulfatase A-like enzyme
MRPAVAAWLGMLLALGCGSASRRGDVLLISVDTLRADHLGIYGYRRGTSPRLDAFFADAAIFERAYSAAAYTSASSVSLLSGRLPQDHGVRLFDQLLPPGTALLPDLLPDDYQTAAFVSNKVLSDKGMGMAHRFDHYDDDAQLDAQSFRLERGAAATTDSVLSWLRGADPGRPLFLWVHYMDPHSPYRAPEPWLGSLHHAQPWRSPPRPIPVYAQHEGSTVRDPLYFVDRYDEEIRYADAEIGRLLDGYAKLRPLDRTLVVFTADHGETLLERRRSFVHALRVFEEVVHVPLMLRGPGVVPGRYDGPVSGIDVAPTLLAFAGAERPPGLAGFDLRRTPLPPPGRSVFVEAVNSTGAQWRAAIQGHRKWVVRVRGPDGEIQRQHIYDLAADPGERAPLPWSDARDPAGGLIERIQADPDPAGLPAHPTRGGLRDQNVDYLKALGYVE